MNGDKLKQAVELLGMSLRDFANLLDVSAKTVSLWANNHSPVPQVVVLYLELRLSNLKMAEQLAKGVH